MRSPSSFSRVEFEQMHANAMRLAEGKDAKRRTAAKAWLEDLKAWPPEQLVEVMFRDAKLKAREKKMIEVLEEHPGATSAELTAAMGWRQQSWHLHFGTMCRDRLGRFIEAPPAPERPKPDGTPGDFFSGLLADYDDATSGFTLRPEARRALIAAGALDNGKDDVGEAASGG